MLQLKILIREARAMIDARRAGAVGVEEIATLNHEALDHPVEFTALVALRQAVGALGLAGAELSEVFARARGGVAEEVEFYAA